MPTIPSQRVSLTALLPLRPGIEIGPRSPVIEYPSVGLRYSIRAPPSRSTIHAGSDTTRYSPATVHTQLFKSRLRSVVVLAGSGTLPVAKSRDCELEPP